MLLAFLYATYFKPAKLHFCEEYTFFRDGVSRHKGWRFWRYSCSCSDSRNCEAHVFMHQDNIIITDTKHNHHPLVYWKTKKAKFIQLASGSKLLLYKKYTFSRSGKTRGGGSRFTCSSSNSKKCKAHIHVNKDNVITLASTEHTHDPVKYMDTKEGYVRINPKYPYHYNVQAEVFND